MPSIACGAGQCMVTYWESRTRRSPATAGLAVTIESWISAASRLNANGRIAGQKLSDFALSVPHRDQAVRRRRRRGAAAPENVNDIARVNEIVGADGTQSCTGPAGAEPPLLGLEPGCIPRLNFYCRPQSGGGTTCFMGDYNAVVPATSFVRGRDGSGSSRPHHRRCRTPDS